MKKVSLSIRDFALPVPRVGSIESNSGFSRSTALGQEIHLAVQARRQKTEANYEPEVMISHEFERGGYLFDVGGRMDGFFDTDPPKIEEIKSSFNLRELSKKLHANPHDHPYCLQLRTYGYFHWLEKKTVPILSFHLVSTRNSESEDLELQLDVEGYERWLDARLDELVIEAEKAEKRSARRRKLVSGFAFPFEKPRPGQVELIKTIEEEIAKAGSACGRSATGRRMLIQAPTGLGKTVGVLYPAMKDALSRGQRVVYVTPKNSQHAVAEDAVRRFQDTGTKVKSLTITAKSKICFKPEPICNPDFCEYAKDHYTKVHEHKIADQLAAKKKLTAKTFRDLGEEFQVCPYEIQLDAAQDADAVICDYNYVFGPRSTLSQTGQMAIDQEGKPNLVVDEAHNLPSRAMDYYSPSVSSIALDRMREDIRALPKRFAQEAEELLDGCIQVILDCKPRDCAKPLKIDPPTEPFLTQDSLLKGFMSRYLESEVEIEPKDPVLRLAFYWSQFTEALEFVIDPSHTEFFTTFNPHPSGGIVKIVCCDASEMLKACYDEFQQVVGFSATLKPFDYYAKLSGLDPAEIKTAEFQSPFEKKQRKLLIIPQISTKWSERERNYPKIADAMARIVALRRGNYFAFFPSFDFLERVMSQFRPPKGFEVLRQERDMKTADIERVLDHLRERSQPTVMFAVQGGVFSEGVDYPGEMIIGAFVVGPPLPSFDLEREQMREYYQKNYGSGFEYAYAYPAMSKAVQAAGRVIRTETDRGLIVLMDNRFIQPTYTQSMPTDWFEGSARELVSSAILKEVSEFWAEHPEPEQPGQVTFDLSPSL